MHIFVHLHVFMCIYINAILSFNQVHLRFAFRLGKVCIIKPENTQKSAIWERELCSSKLMISLLIGKGM